MVIDAFEASESDVSRVASRAVADASKNGWVMCTLTPTGSALNIKELAEPVLSWAVAEGDRVADAGADDGQVLAGTRADDGSFIGTTQLLRTRLIEPPTFRRDEVLEGIAPVLHSADADGGAQ